MMAKQNKYKNQKKHNDYSRNGINITDSLSLTINSNRFINPKLILILISLSGIIGFTASFLSLFSFECNYKLLYSAIAAAFLFFSVIFMFPSKSKLILIPVYILIGAGIYRHIKIIVYGYEIFINTISRTLKIIKPEYSYYMIPDTFDQNTCITTFLIFLFIIITSIICYNTIVKPRFLFVFCCTFPFIEAGLYFGFSPDHLPFFVLIAYWIAVFSMRVAGNQFHSTSGQPVFVRKDNMFISTGNLRNNVIETIGLISLLAVFAVFVISQAVLSLISYERSDKVNETRYNLKHSVSEISIDKLMKMMEETSKSNPVSNVSRLGNLDSLRFDNKTDISVMISDKYYDNIYLKGFTAGEYKNNTWYSFSDYEYSKYNSLFAAFESSGCYPQSFNFLNDSVLSDIYPDKFHKRQMIINSLFASNPYAFTPYGVSVSGVLEPKYDSIITGNGKNNYSFSCVTSSNLYKNLSLVTDNINVFSKNPVFYNSEKLYRDFVYKQYLSLPDSKELDKLKKTFSDIPKYDGTNVEQIAESIKKILHSSAEYSLDPGKTPYNKELSSYMLLENHKGYCSHFATSAIILARMNGLPARYAEGYVITPDDLNKATYVNSYYKLQVSDSRAHAWAEFYIDGYGWLPFEFTPGYDHGIIPTDEKKESVQTSVVEKTVPVTDITEPPHETEKKTTAVTTVPQSTESNVTSPVGAVSETSSVTENPVVQGSSSFTVLIKKILGFILIVFISGTLIYTVHIITIRKRIKSFHSKSNKQSIINIYAYMIRLLEYFGVCQGNMLPLEFAEYAEENAESLSESGDISKLIRYSLESAFGSKEPDTEQRNDAIRIVNNIADKIYASQNVYRKFIFKYIRNLI